MDPSNQPPRNFKGPLVAAVVMLVAVGLLLGDRLGTAPESVQADSSMPVPDGVERSKSSAGNRTGARGPAPSGKGMTVPPRGRPPVSVAESGTPVAVPRLPAQARAEEEPGASVEGVRRATAVLPTADESSLSLSELLEAAQQGQAEAQYELGQRHLKGEFGDADSEVAMQWFFRAGQQGHGAARDALQRASEAGQGSAGRYLRYLLSPTVEGGRAGDGGTTYSLQTSGRLRVGQTGVLRVTVRAAPGYQWEADYPAALFLKNGDRVRFEQLDYRSTRGEIRGEPGQGLVVIRATGLRAGIETVPVQFRFAICDEQGCTLHRETLSLIVTVE